MAFLNNRIIIKFYIEFTSIDHKKIAIRCSIYKLFVLVTDYWPVFRLILLILDKIKRTFCNWTISGNDRNSIKEFRPLIANDHHLLLRFYYICNSHYYSNSVVPQTNCLWNFAKVWLVLKKIQFLKGHHERIYIADFNFKSFTPYTRRFT